VSGIGREPSGSDAQIKNRWARAQAANLLESKAEKEIQ
jgi:hypothetical protein